MKALIFDFGGVIGLRKSEDMVPIFPDFDLWDKASCGEVEEDFLWQKVMVHTGKSLEEILNQLLDERIVNEDLITFLRENKGRYKFDLINNGLYKMLEKALRDWGLEDLFDVVINSAKEKMSKPDPRIFILASKRLGVAMEDCYFFDDKQKHVDSAIKCGMKGFVYEDVEQIRVLVEA